MLTVKKPLPECVNPANLLRNLISLMSKSIPVFLSFLFLSRLLFSQEIQFERLSTKQGLSSGVVAAVVQDREGFMWFGTKNGLVRHDGYSFVTYEHHPLDSLSFSGSDILSICEDRRGQLWVGTDGNGLNRFDRQTGHFRHYRNDPRRSGSLSHDDVYCVLEDRSGRLWIGTWGGGLNRYDPQTDGFVHYRHEPGNAKTLSDDYIITLFQDGAGFIWIGTSFGGLNKLDPQTGEFTSYRIGVKAHPTLADRPIWAICEDDAGYLWIGTDEGGLYRFHPGDGSLRMYQHDPQDARSLSHNSVTSLFKEDSENLWVGTWGGGLCRLNVHTGQFESYRYSRRNTQSLSSDIVWTIAKERSGTMWVATDGGGVCKFKTNRKNFDLYTYDPAVPQASLSHSVIRAICEDRTGILWIGTAGSGLDRLDPRTGRVTNYLPDTRETPMLTHMNVISICEDRNGRIWFGNFRGGLSCYDPKTGRARRYLNAPADSTSLSDSRVMTVYQDRQGHIWVGTYENGLNRFELDKQSFTRFRHDPKNPSSLSNDEVRTILEDHQGHLWIGTLGGGLNRFDQTTGQFIRFQHDPNNAASLSSNAVRCLYEDKNGYLWVGTNDRGLNRFDPSTQKFAHYTLQDGLPNETVLGILGDDAGNLWISTNKGLCRLNPANGKCRNFHSGHGLQGSEFGIGAYHRGRSGKMYFGGFGGLNAFHPDSIQENTFVPPVVITDFRIFDRPSTARLQLDRIELSYQENFFSFEFAALSYYDTERNQYAYQLQGVDPGWIYSGSRRYASYTNLEEGEYLFQVKAANSDGVWNETGTSVKLIITPPFWRTPWFRALAITLFMAILYAGYAIRVNSIKARNRKLEVLVSERTRELERKKADLEKSLAETELRRQEAQQQRLIAVEANRVKSELMGITAHDLKNPLGGIMLYTELIRDSLNQPEEVAKFTEVIRATAQNLYHLINNLLKTVRAESQQLQPHLAQTDLRLLAERVVNQNLTYARTKKQGLQFECASHCPAFVDADMITEVFDNLVSNAIKYSPPEKTIWVSLQIEAAGVRFQVRDEGPGLSRQDLKKIFGSFQRLSAKPTGNESSFGLGLYIVRKLVELHGGKVEAYSEGKGKGATFTVILPYAAQHQLALELDMSNNT